jgi:hypothetical protein
LFGRITDVYADAVLTPTECDEALASFPPTKPGETNQSLVKRSSKVGFVHEPKWSFWEKLRQLVYEVNARLHRFDIETERCPRLVLEEPPVPALARTDLLAHTEPVQLSEYQVGDEYDWHLDLGPGPASRRKLSLSVQLTEPNEYEGGDLEIKGVHNIPALRKRGSVIIFPSFLLHRVTPVTRGVRRSLVAWVPGEKPFR